MLLGARGRRAVKVRMVPCNVSSAPVAAAQRPVSVAAVAARDRNGWRSARPSGNRGGSTRRATCALRGDCSAATASPWGNGNARAAPGGRAGCSRVHQRGVETRSGWAPSASRRQFLVWRVLKDQSTQISTQAAGMGQAEALICCHPWSIHRRVAAKGSRRRGARAFFRHVNSHAGR